MTNYIIPSKYFKCHNRKLSKVAIKQQQETKYIKHNNCSVLINVTVMIVLIEHRTR